MLKRSERGLPDGRIEVREPGRPTRYIRRDTDYESYLLGLTYQNPRVPLFEPAADSYQVRNMLSIIGHVGANYGAL